MKVGIFHTAFIGDIALSSLLIEALFQEKHEIYLITRKASILLYKNDPRIKGFVSADKAKGIKKINSLRTIANQIKALNLEVLLVPHKSTTSALCAYLSHVPKRISYNDSSLRFLYTENLPFHKEKHECIRCLDIAPRWLVSETTYQNAVKIARPILKPAQDMPTFNLKNPHFFQNNNSFFIVSPGSVWATKKYPPQHFAKAIFSLLSKNKNIRCILTGTQQDKMDINTILSFFAPFSELSARIIDTSMYLPLDEFVTLISKAQFVIANDSSPIHIASGSNIPVVSIFGPTTWKFGFYPTSDKNVVLNYKDENGNTLACHPCTPHGSQTCPQKHFRCMLELSPDLLANSVEKLLPELFIS
ncbi:glycosyltransferase family 9 protein [Fluviispira vulneris]|uniref:glycosyltransferase family 9 protein n=1 Tax=Fluviispira vulneris TaxID=2763012 RepID=UPI0016477904|nr:glycosyltransferase family 9 protein [Fluviispira vulneris]